MSSFAPLVVAAFLLLLRRADGADWIGADELSGAAASCVIRFLRPITRFHARCAMKSPK
jgi:hypothetical protein